MKIAIVHEWLSTYAGSERVVEQLLKLYPAADLFALVDFLPEADRGFLGGRTVNTSFVQKLPFARKRFRGYLPLMPLAVEQFDLSKYDLVISSNHAVAKGVITGPDQVHVSYIHTPIRYAWDLQHQYLREAGLARGPKSWATRALLHYMRSWDQAAANRVDIMVANSHYIARRIWSCYRREAHVIHPPVDVDSFELCVDKNDFYLAASRMVPYKRMDTIVEAFARMPERRLVVIGDGPELEKVRAKATSNVTIMGYQPFSVLRDHMRRARAFVFAAEEDFGIMPVEAMACGTPVIAYGKGGALDSVWEHETGLFFESQTPQAIADAVGRFEACCSSFDPFAIRAHAEGFAPARFREEFAAAIAREVDQFKVSRPAPVSIRTRGGVALAKADRLLPVEDTDAVIA